MSPEIREQEQEIVKAGIVQRHMEVILRATKPTKVCVRMNQTTMLRAAPRVRWWLLLSRKTRPGKDMLFNGV